MDTIVFTYKNFKAEILADSISPWGGHRLTSMEVIFPRIVLAEFNTHRLLSRNSASSRAIPIEKMIQAVLENPFIPDRFPRKHKGMQAEDDNWVSEGSEEYEVMKAAWLRGRDRAVETARELLSLGYSKQLANRPLETYLMHKVIVTTTEYSNFFALRAHRDAQNEIQIIAGLMLKALNSSKPTLLRAGQWHSPFGKNIDPDRISAFANSHKLSVKASKCIIGIARSARVSYGNFEGQDNYDSDYKVFESLSTNGHWSPFEHVARAMTQREYFKYSHTFPNGREYGWCGNIRGFIQYRKLFDEKVENRPEPRLKKH